MVYHITASVPHGRIKMVMYTISQANKWQIFKDHKPFMIQIHSEYESISQGEA